MPDLPPIVKRRVTAQVLARVFGVHPDTIAYWADRGTIPAGRLPSGTRTYDAIAIVAHLRARGATVPPELEALATASAA